MDILVLGAGMMGRAAAYDLVKNGDVSKVTVADIDEAKAADVKKFAGGDRIDAKKIDVSDFNAVVNLMKGFDAVISAVTYRFNYDLARAAIKAMTNFCDLGGNNLIVEKELSLDRDAKNAGITIIPDCGLAPGMVSVLAADALGHFDELDELHIRVGGLPQNPKPPLNYKILFSPSGLINEYKEDAVVIRDGEIVTIESMTDIEEISFPPPFGRLEAFNTSGGSSTLPKTFLGKVRDLDYKTIRYKGHCEIFKAMLDIGLVSEELIRVGSTEVTPRALFEEVLRKSLSDDDKDVVLVRVIAKGRAGGVDKAFTYDIIDYHDDRTGLSAMMRMTAFPASIIARMMAFGEIAAKGAVPQELSVPPKRFIEELKKRNIAIEIS